jgi:hypothetical protein
VAVKILGDIYYYLKHAKKINLKVLNGIELCTASQTISIINRDKQDWINADTGESDAARRVISLTNNMPQMRVYSIISEKSPLRKFLEERLGKSYLPHIDYISNQISIILISAKDIPYKSDIIRLHTLYKSRYDISFFVIKKHIAVGISRTPNLLSFDEFVNELEI